MLNILSFTTSTTPLSEFPSQEKSLKKIPNENSKKEPLKTYVSTKDVLSFQYKQNQALVPEIRAFTIYSLFKKYAPAIDLEIRRTSNTFYKEKGYSKVMAYDKFNQLFFIENSCYIDLKLNIDCTSVDHFDGQEVRELLKTISWKFKECRENQDSYFYDEWKFDEKTSLLRPLKGYGFKKSIRLGKSKKREKFKSSMSQLVLEAFVILNNSFNIPYLVGTFQTTHNVIVGFKIFDKLIKVTGQKRKNSTTLSKNIKTSNPEPTYTNTTPLTSNFIPNHFTPSNQTYATIPSYLSEQPSLSINTYSNFLKEHSSYPALAAETDSSESITPIIYPTPPYPFCNEPFSVPLITLPSSSASDLNFLKPNEQEQPSFDSLNPFFVPPLSTSFNPLTTQSNSYKNRQIAHLSANYSVNNNTLEIIKLIFNRATTFEKIEIINWFKKNKFSLC
jgi:hypothetical protein